MVLEIKCDFFFFFNFILLYFHFWDFLLKIFTSELKQKPTGTVDFSCQVTFCAEL